MVNQRGETDRMSEPTLKSLLAELAVLKLPEDARRLADIAAELANQADALTDELPRLAKSLSYAQRAAAALVFGHLRREADVPLILGLLADAHAWVRVHAARACERFPRREAIPRL